MKMVPAPGDQRRGTGIFRSVDDPGVVFILVEFDSSDDAKAGRARLLASGTLDRFPDKTEPAVIEEAETVRY